MFLLTMGVDCTAKDRCASFRKDSLQRSFLQLDGSFVVLLRSGTKPIASKLGVFAKI